MPNYYSNLSPNDFFPLRARNLFDPSIQPDLPYDPVSRMNELYKPREDITNLLMEQLRNIPQREKPSNLRRIGAALAGLGTSEPANWWGGVPVGFKSNPKEAMQVSDQFLNKPYYDKLSDFEVKNKALLSGSELEQRQNSNQRILANETVGRELQEKGLAEKTRAALEREQQNKIKSDQIYDIKLQDMQRKVDESAEKVRVAEANLAQKGATAEATLKLREAELAALNARHALDIAQRQKALDETKILHETMKKKWEEENKDRDTRLNQYEKQLGLKKSDNKTTTVEVKDAKGNTTSTRRTTTTTGGNSQQPNDAIRARAIEKLKLDKKPQTEANIKWMMDKLGKQ